MTDQIAIDHLEDILETAEKARAFVELVAAKKTFRATPSCLPTHHRG